MRGKGLRRLALFAFFITFLSSAVSPVNAEIVLFQQGRLSSGWTIGTDSHKQKSSKSICAASVAAEDFDLNTQESFYLQKLANSKKDLSGKDAILIELESCDSDILEGLTFSPRFDGILGRHALPQIPMADYKLNESQQNSSSSYTFLFPMSYLDSIWRNETFDRLTVRCKASGGKCQLALTYAAIIPASEIKELLTTRFTSSDLEDQQFQPSPLIPGQPLFYWICSIFPFLWCPPPAPPPILPPPQLPVPFPPLDPEDPDDDYDYDDEDEYNDGDDDDDYNDEDGNGVRAYLLPNANYGVYAQSGQFQKREKVVTVYRTYGLGSFRARIIFPVKEGEEERKFPVIVFAHGLSATSRNYLTKMRHFASHGFIVIAPESFNLFDGVDLLECLPYLAGEDKTPSSSLFGIVDSDQVGLVGHSMGGAGSLAAASRVGASGSIKCVAAIHPAPLVGLGSVQVPAFISAGYNDVVTAPLPIKGTIYDSSLLKGPKLMAILRNAGHMEPVDGIGFQRWTPYLTAWFKSYLYSDLEASTLIWGKSSPQSLQQNSQMSAVHSFPGMSVTMSSSPSVVGGGLVNVSAKVRNNLARDTQYQMFYYSSKYPELESIDFKPAISPILSEGDALSFTVEATVKSNTTAASEMQIFVISRDRFANGTTTSSFVVPI